MRTTELIVTAEFLASDLAVYAEDEGLTPVELVMVLACAERLVQASCFPGNPQGIRDTVMTANATFDALSNSLEKN